MTPQRTRVATALMILLLLGLPALWGCDVAPARPAPSLPPVATATPTAPLITPATLDRLTLLQSFAAFSGGDVAWAPDSRTLAVSVTTTVQLWDVATSTLRRTLVAQPLDTSTEQPLPSIQSVAFAPDGQTVVSGPDRVVRRWHVGDGLPLSALGPNEIGTYFDDIQFAPDGQTLLADTGLVVQRWQFPAGTPLPPLQGAPKIGNIAEGIGSIAITADSRLLAVAYGTGQVLLWQLPAGTLQRTLHGPPNGLIRIAFAPDGQTLAVGGPDGTVRLWRVSDGALVRTLTGAKNQTTSLSFTPDGQLLAATANNITCIWRVVDGALLHTNQDKLTIFFKVAFSPDGRLLAVRMIGNEVALWGVR
ncbi:MAG: hypothetical protein M3Z04_21430 [Chloroflexota bacterium]|nr:hypothetical protein [Chloroflexota bacterium]